jgi:hypothetical protein
MPNQAPSPLPLRDAEGARLDETPGGSALVEEVNVSEQLVSASAYDIEVADVGSLPVFEVTDLFL